MVRLSECQGCGLIKKDGHEPKCQGLRCQRIRLQPTNSPQSNACAGADDDEAACGVITSMIAGFRVGGIFLFHCSFKEPFKM